MASAPDRQPLPFEPKGKVSGEASAMSASKGKSSKSKVAETLSQSAGKSKASRLSGGQSSAVAESIPKVVSNRMIRRMAIFSGGPTFLAMGIFVASYVLLTRHILEFPKVVVLLSTLGCFGLGVLGLSYGVLSASWEEDREGSLFGLSEFSVNFKRMVQGMRAAKNKQ